MTLPEILSALSELVPERVLWVGEDSARIRVGEQLTYLDLTDAAQFAPWLEYALREEIEGRFWMWRVFALPGQSRYGGEIEKRVVSKCFLEYGDTPAQALAGALLAAMEGEG